VLYSWLQTIEFAYPWMFLLLALVPAMIYWYVNVANRKQATLLVSSIRSFGETRSLRAVFRHVPFILRLLTVTCLVVALARPQVRNDEELISGEGIDIMLCMDVSGSMLAQDFTPSTL
jgi:Ca-activated chloride channel family protein